MTRSTGNEKSPRHASAAGVEFEWRIEGDVMKGRMSAKTRGWVTVGFNTVRDLRGTRLVMGYVDGDRTVVEEHIADPPDHRPKVQLGGTSGVVSASGREVDGTTTIEFELRLDTGDSFDVPLVPGRSYFTTFAWSHEDDLYHHSAMRSAIDLVL
ncbi:MAG TPA: DOMON domain-containing protein [Kofleriaceae bacterium]|nr:DOMON domain-containing protein [Kofleriaceae bacterium]